MATKTGKGNTAGDQYELTEDEKETLREYKRAWWKANPDKARAYKKKYWAKKTAERLRPESDSDRFSFCVSDSDGEGM